MNDELIYHQLEINDKPVLAEFLLYDFRFWYEVEARFNFFNSDTLIATRDLMMSQSLWYLIART